MIGPILWTCYFIEAQDYPIKENILNQDNQSTIKLATNGPKSAGKRSRHLDIRFYFLYEMVSKGLVTVKYCSMDEMDSDYHSKLLQGFKFHKFRCRIMGMPPLPEMQPSYKKE